MGYSKSKRAIRRVEPYLEQMVAAEGEISFPAEEPSDFAYRLREGIKASTHFALDERKQPIEPYADYAGLSAKYLIRVKGPLVVCEPRDVVPIARLRSSLAQVSIPDVSETLGIIGAAITHKAPSMVFPQANAQTVKADRLFVWAQANGYFLVVGDNHVTLTKQDPGELAWNP